MAYTGTTAASTASNPPRELIPRMGGLAAQTTQLTTAAAGTGGGQDPYRMQTGGLWLYASSEASTAVTAANYFTDAKRLGMRPGDVIFGVSWTTLGSSAELFVSVVNSVTTAGASLSTSARISST